jgi:hypothetical protein
MVDVGDRKHQIWNHRMDVFNMNRGWDYYLKNIVWLQLRQNGHATRR